MLSLNDKLLYKSYLEFLFFGLQLFLHGKSLSTVLGQTPSLSLNAAASQYVSHSLVIQPSAAYSESMHEFSSRSMHRLLRKRRNDW